ncbi:citrulline utilization hydrolase CtlX [Rubrolithibacter danxiaensis]|uniref:citrulline utilization hydrolase CtlX n=1 Tax=Rubrolithibacter danxiaensis TaxID=3390805 RepID=UPI003BF7924A
MQATSNILMIRPVQFDYNEQTALSNAFQNSSAANAEVQKKALEEFDRFTEILQKNGVNVLVVEDTPAPHTPDSIFPNNWIATYNDGKVFLYPMQAENRRQERRTDIIDTLKTRFTVSSVTDLSYFESEEKFLEGTGSMVLDRDNKIAYACLSPRTDPEVLKKFCDLSSYKLISFNSTDKSGKAIYHTNVMMCIGNKFAVICLETILDEAEKANIISSLKNTGKEIIEITEEQMNSFAGNMLELKNTHGESLLIMSEQALNSLRDDQISILKKHAKIISSSLNTIETNGGGSARCMIAEIHLPEKINFSIFK